MSDEEYEARRDEIARIWVEVLGGAVTWIDEEEEDEEYEELA